MHASRGSAKYKTPHTPVPTKEGAEKMSQTELEHKMPLHKQNYMIISAGSKNQSDSKNKLSFNLLENQ